MPPDISIVTPALNQVSLLADVIENVRSQYGVSIQHIVVDGGSTDGTIDLLRSYGESITWVSEPDGGQAEAINKGLSLAQAAVVGWINCDDRYAPGALALAHSVFAASPALHFLYGDALGVDLKGRPYGVRTHVGPCGLAELVVLGDPIVQPAAFWTRALWESVGPLDESLTYAFDYEFWMRAAAVTTLEYLPVCLAVESIHGAAKTSRGSIARLHEIEEIAIRHGGQTMPRGFQAEATAVEMWAGLSSAVRGDFDLARDSWTDALKRRPPMTRFAMHGVAQAVPGTGTVPRLRLWANWMRSRRNPVYPTQPAAKPLVSSLIARLSASSPRSSAERG